MWYRTSAVLLLLTLVLAACSNGTDSNRIEGQKVYRHSLDGAPSSLDPVQSATIYANHLVVNIYDTLYSYEYLTRPYQIKPNLAVAMPEVSEDGLTYTISIKQGVEFTDDPAFPDGRGRELTAHDFVYSLKRHFDKRNRSQGAWLWQGRIVGLDDWKAAGSDYAAEIEGLQALDRYSIRIKLVLAGTRQIQHTDQAGKTLPPTHPHPGPGLLCRSAKRGRGTLWQGVLGASRGLGSIPPGLD